MSVNLEYQQDMNFRIDSNHRKNGLIELDRPPITETAVLVRLALPADSAQEVEESLAEMRRLAWTAGANVVETFVQRRTKPCPATLIGLGKASHVAEVCRETDADLAIFDSDLTPAQGAKLQDILGVKVVDRTQLILDIFAQRARTNEGKHQVELAQLQYTLPRLRGRGIEMMQQTGGIGTRGPGEQKLEVDRRVIRRRIDRLRVELDNIRRSRRIQRKRRGESAAATVALVGYTNAGKSSLLNALTGADAFVENKLFATLDPCSRRCTLPSGREIVITDTVGFIRKLPHDLVAAFRATLEEINEANVILLVADAAHPAVDEHINVVNDVLSEILDEPKPTLKILNKTDIAEPGSVLRLCNGRDRSIAVSARTGAGLEPLLNLLERELAPNWSRVRLRIPQSAAGVVAQIYEGGRVLNRRYEDQEIVLDAEIGPDLQGKMAAYIAPGK
ncbi:MAG: GTPase HflX [Candidatus Hydrogenedentes bacterium]|nr:GTPase HflX [Candidatus Hydrogenedentota bacterium]